MYSVRKDAVFCYNCKLFSPQSNIPLVRDGFRDWQHLSRHTTIHETSVSHVQSYKKFVEMKNHLDQNKTVDAHHQKIIEHEKKRWQNVLHRIFSCIQFLAKQNLALRGSTSKLYKKK